MKKQRGYTLIEVVASIVIISIILTSFIAVFQNNNQHAVNNTDKLVVVNIADMHLERLRLEGQKINSVYNPTPPITETINGRNYKVTYQFSQSVDELSMKLQNIVVHVEAIESKTKAKVEGYIKYE